MATGTQGPDYLVNDTSVEFDFINGLGGDDTIQISPTNVEQAVVRIDGGSGFDTLIYRGSLWSASPGELTGGYGTLSPRNDFFYTGIERLIIDATAVSHTGYPDLPSFVGGPVFLSTGDTIDTITLDSLRFADVHVRTGGGDDEIFLRDVGPFSTARGGTGNDLIDFTAGNAVYSADGEEGNDTLLGGGGPDRLDGGPGDDFLSPGAGTPEVHPGEPDLVFEFAKGGAGNDVIYFGANMDPTDRADGGSETDQLILQGDYSLGLVLVADSITGIETLSMLSASDSTFSSDGGGGLHDYVLTTHDSNFAAGIRARVDGAGLLAGEDMTFNGSAETNASFLVYGGKGADRITGGLGNDIFFFGLDGRFSPGDSVNGGAGSDNLILRGNYTINFGASGYAGALQSVETLTLSSASDVRYASGGTEFDYTILWADGLLGAGRTITVSGALLRSNETMTFDGTREKDGSFQIFAGAANDQLSGGRGSDMIYGGLGGDRMLGNGGNDVFRYDKVAESTASARDTIRDFNLDDLVDLSRIDASTLASGNQAFTFIGTAAFGNQAGQLRVESQREPVWLLQGDTDGDGIADFELTLVVVDSHPLTAADFVL
ncbi:MAG: calcium-binding protein [Allosphingosinicella sp.]